MELTTRAVSSSDAPLLFMMSKIQNLNGTHNACSTLLDTSKLFMMSKIQNLNGTHNSLEVGIQLS